MCDARTKKIKKVFAQVGSTYIVARVCSFKPRYAQYEIRWVDTMFNNAEESVDLNTVRRGRDAYSRLMQQGDMARWKTLCRADSTNAMVAEVDMNDLTEMEEFSVPSDTPVSVHDVEAIKNMRFDPHAQLPTAPDDLHAFPDGSTTTYVKPEYRHMFEHSPCSSFLAYIPIYFWKQVLVETNSSAQALKIAKPFTIDELMKFLGIMFYMALVDKGEIRNYWSDQADSTIFGLPDSSLANVMPLRRFWDLRRAFCIRDGAQITPEDSKADSAVRIRSLLNLLKSNGSKYVEVGRNVAVDEASVACRSKFGRHLIMYNPKKPGGKYHFRFYMCCCSTSWIALNFRLHCTSDIATRLNGMVSRDVALALEADLDKSAMVRKHVLEVMQPFFYTNRIVNCDNYYTSVQLLAVLRIKGLYGRGTVRRTSKHFPHHVILQDHKGPKNRASRLLRRHSTTTTMTMRKLPKTL